MPATKRQLLQTKRVLKAAYDLILDCQGTFHNTGNAGAADRLRDLASGVLLELEYLDRLLSVLP